jgi:hypothetical protein
MKIMKLTMGGPQIVAIKGRAFGVPGHALVHHVRDDQGGAMAYVYDGVTVHCLVEHGEVAIPQRLQELVKDRIFGVD